MDDDKYDDSFSDDGIDELPPGTLLELERNAFQASQQQRPDSRNASNNAPPKPRNPSFASLARGSLSRTASHTSSRGPVLQDPSRLLRPPLSFGDEDFQDLDAGVLDDGCGPDPVELQDRVFQQNISHGRLHPGGQEAGLCPDKGARDMTNGNITRPAAQHAASLGNTIIMSGMEDMTTDAAREEHGAAAPVSEVWAEIEAMKEQIEQLTRERERIAQELAAAKSMTEVKAGEIAIIRANQAKVEKAHSRQLSTLRTQMADELKKYQAEIEAATMESKLLTTENAFLKQDLKDETQKLNELRKAKAKLEENPPLTPKKSKILPLRDGFDDDEIMLSPTKSAGRRSKRGTPSVSGGRKRKAIDDSPIKAPTLELSQSFETNLGDFSESAEPMVIDSGPRKPNMEDRNVRFMRRILNHKTYPSKGRDLEIFTKLAFPSEPGRMFSSFILEATTAKSSENYAVEYAKAIISLWSRALKESFYDPVAMFMAIIKYIINLDPSNIVPQLIDDLLPVLLKSGYVNGVARFRNSPVSHQNLGQIKQTPQSELHHQVNSTEALNILYLAASSCQHDFDAQRKFWQNILYDFILVMLNSNQPIDDIIITLNLLSYSILPTSFGPLLSTPAEQTANENYIIDRVANLLSEQPYVDEGEKPYTPWQISTLRIEAMSFLTTLAFSSPHPSPSKNHAGRLLALHPTALARVFRSIHDELDALYSNPPERELHVALVNGLTRLAYGIMSTFRDEVNLPAKLRVVPGATQKHLVALTRLAFCEGPLLEAGIEDDTVEMAHEMLEEAVNPQEAEALLEAFRVKSLE
ncbi:DNA repair protein Rad26 [Blastomyces dermatitidis ATCC 18188]|uniref:DNA repair protein Rad26 n=1 Tax=Ajellomyces dermatitidis (strain ATCC 18188 / CBS 674.68) TaxID=653446 RepID=F2TDX3_AJEDA|nr:DNA repair protein Rad26 [Blastomyces dermatitidis ATCC 18188]